jgi:iron complex outermembrane receptor protein
MVLFSVLACSSVLADDSLDTLVIEDTLNINPNVSQPEKLTRTEATSADGGDFLNQINGVSMSRFGGRGLEPIIRGQSQTRLNVLLDGAYIHGGCPNRMDPPSSWAALETYEEVKVAKGVQTLTKGGGGSGGTVSFERDSKALAEEQGVHGRVSAMVSDNHIKSDLLADVVVAGEKAYVRGIFQHKDADNYEDGDGNEVRSSFKHKQAGIIAGYTPTDNRLFEFSHEKNDFTDALYPGSGMDSPEETATITRLRYKDKPASSNVDEINADIYVSDVEHVMDNYSLRPNSGMKMRTPTTSKTTGGRLVLKSSTDSTLWEYGLDIQKNQRDAQLDNMNTGIARTVSTLWPDVEITQVGVFAEATHKLDDQKKLKAGIRIDQVDTSHNKANEQSDLMGGRTANQSYNHYYGTTATDKTETNVGGLLRYEQSLNNDVTAFAGISRTVRTADATERGVNKWVAETTSRWVGNPDIKPEKHHQIDIGLTKRTNKYSASATVFYDKVDDYILRDAASLQTGILKNDQADIYRNVEAELYGIEAEASTELTDNLDLSGSLAYVHATNATDDRPIAQTPPLNGKIQLDYEKNRWSAGSRIRFANAQNRIDENSKQEVGTTPGYAVLDVYGNYRLNKTLNLRYGVDNVMDKTYAEHSSRSNLLDNEAIKVNEPGRTAWLKLTAEF